MAVVQKPLVSAAQIINNTPAMPPKVKAPETPRADLGGRASDTRSFGGRSSVDTARAPNTGSEPRQSAGAQSNVWNAVSQVGRAVPAADRAILRMGAAPGIWFEKNIGQPLMRALGFNPSEKGMFAKTAQALNESSLRQENERIQAPQTQAAEAAATVSTAVGEALPIAAMAVATGGSGAALTGTSSSWAASGLSAAGRELIQDPGNTAGALIAGGTEAATSMIGGKVVGALTSGIGSKALAWGIDALGEGAEEVFSGVLQSALIGDSYSLEQAGKDFALGATVGAIMNTAVHGINAVKAEIGTAKTVHDIRSGRGGGALEGLSKSVEIARANPEKYGDVARAVAEPATNSTFDLGRFRDFVEGAVEASGKSSVKFPSNIENISAQNIGSYHTLYDTPAVDPNWGMNQAASVLEAAQVGKGLSPRQSGNILRAVLETNSDLYSQLSQIGANSTANTDAVQIERGAEYRNTVPTAGPSNNYSVMAVQGRAAQAVDADTPINVFRGMSSEWVIPTMATGEFAVPNSSPAIGKGEKALFGRSPGQMLGAGLYLTSVPSKADQYSSGVQGDISLQGSDSAGIMANSPIFGATTYVNEAALNAAAKGVESDTVKMGRAGSKQEATLADFINENQANSEAAVIYSKMGDDYTEVVRPDAVKTQVERLYIPLNTEAAEAGSVKKSADAVPNTSSTVSNMPNAAELGRMQADRASAETIKTLGNAEVNALLEQNISNSISTEAVAGMVDTALKDSWDDAAVGRNMLAPENAIRAETGPQALEPAENKEITIDADKPQSPTESGAEVNPPPPSDDMTPVEETQAEETPTPEVETPKDGSPPEATPTPEEGTPTNEDPPSDSGTPTKIWTPIQTMIEENKRRRRDEVPANSFNMMRGQGFQGKIQETSGYNETFGGLSSF